MTRVLITGANGFIGGHVVRRLIGNQDVRCAIRTADSALPEWRKQCGIVVVGDIGPSTRWEDALKGVDSVIHLAALAHRASPDLEQLTRVNVEGFCRLVHACQAVGVKRLILLSTIGVLGNETGQDPYTENSPVRPHDLYSRSKLQAEEILREAAGRSTLEFVIIRPPLVYGPGAPGNFGRLLRLVKRGIPVPFGALQNRRSLVSVANLADFISVATTHPAAANETFVISDGEDVSTPGLIRAIAQASGERSRVFYVPLSLLKFAFATLGKTDYFVRLCGSLVVDSSYARERLSWQPPESLKDGLKRACP